MSQSEYKESKIDIGRLHSYSAFESGIWGIKPPISRQEVTDAIAEGRLQPSPVEWQSEEFNGLQDLTDSNWRKAHVERIAYLVVHPDGTPIEIDVGVPALGSANPWIVEDGHHRLAAAFYRGDQYISAYVSGQVDYANHLLDIPEELVAERKHQVSSDGRTVWVNSAEDGCCLARFGRGGIDIHRGSAEQATMGACLHCTHGYPTIDDWGTFVKEVKEVYGVDIGGEHKPLWLRAG